MFGYRSWFLLFVGAISLPVLWAQAATFNDVAAGNWNDPATWGGTTVPGYSDTVTIDSHAVALSAHASSSSLTISGTGSLSLGSNILATKSFFHTSGGVFDAGTGTISFGNVGTLDVNGTETFYNFILNEGVSYDLTIGGGDRIIVNGTLTLINGSFVSYPLASIDANGPVVIGAGADGGNGIYLLLDDPGDQTIACSSGGEAPNLKINKSAGAVSFSCDSLKFDGLLLQSGTFNSPSNLTFNSSITISGGEFVAGEVVNFVGNLTVNVNSVEDFNDVNVSAGG